MEKTRNGQIHTESKAQLVEQIDSFLHSGDYSRALDLLRGAAAGFRNDAQLSALEKQAQDGVKRNAEANQLITQSQELFAQQKSADAIQLLREAYELDKKNSRARAILANALVEHAHSVVETDWLKAETLTNQALALIPTNPTARTILELIVAKKETSSVEDWVAQASRLQSAGDLFAALGWVAEGLAVHPQDPKLLQIQNEIQRDQDARRRQARRGDLDDLRRMQREIDGAADIAAKQTLAERIQAVAAKHWTDGEILSIANALLLRLGLVPQESSGASRRGKGATVILHVPRPSVPNATPAAISPVSPSPVAVGAVAPSPVPSVSVPTSAGGAIQEPQRPIPTGPASPKSVSPSPAPPSPVLATPAPSIEVAASPVQPSPVPASPVAPNPGSATLAPPTPVPPTAGAPTQVPRNPNLREDIRARIRRRKGSADVVLPDPGLTPTPGTPLPTPQAAAISAAATAPGAKVTPAASRPKQPAKFSSTKLVIVSAIAVAAVLVVATFFFTRKHYAPSVAEAPADASSVSPSTSPAPAASAPAVSPPAQPTAEPSVPALPLSSDTSASDTGAGKVTVDSLPPIESAHDVGALLVVAGQDNAKIFLNGKLQRQLTQGGQLRLPNLELKDYVVNVSKSGFQDPPSQTIRIRKGELARLVFNLQPQPALKLASLTIQGGAPGTTVSVDQTLVGTIQPDGTLSVSNIAAGDHIVELSKERFQSRQLKEHFVVGKATSLAAADVVLEAAPGDLKISFTPADANVALVKGDVLKMVSSGVPLHLPAGTYTLTARTADRYTRSSTVEVIAGKSTTLNLSLAPGGMSKWDDPGAWKPEKDSFVRRGGDYVLYGAVPTAGTFEFSAMLVKGHILQWVFNYTDPKNFVLYQMDDNTFYRAVIRNGEKTSEIKVADKSSKKNFRTLRVRVSPTEIVHQIKHGDSWAVLDRWTQPGANLSRGKFGFYIPGDDQIALSGFTHYADLNLR